MNNIKHYYYLLVLFTVLCSFSNPTNYWKLLRQINYAVQFNPKTENFDKRPIFTNEIKTLDGQTITIEGYILPIRGFYEGSTIMSVYPFDAFCCRIDHLETMLNIQSEQPIKVGMDDKIRLQGIFRLNQADTLHYYYSLEQATLVETASN